MKMTQRLMIIILGTPYTDPRRTEKKSSSGRKDTASCTLMMSTEGGEPTKLAEGVFDYDIGDNFVAYSKGGQVYVAYTNATDTVQLTNEVTRKPASPRQTETASAIMTKRINRRKTRCSTRWFSTRMCPQPDGGS